MDGETNLSLSTMQSSGDLPMPAPMLLAGWWGDKFNRLFMNSVKTPKLKSVSVNVDLLPERRVASISSAAVGIRPALLSGHRCAIRDLHSPSIGCGIAIPASCGLSKVRRCADSDGAAIAPPA